MTTLKDFSSIVLLLGDIKGTPDILALSENSKYEVKPPEDADESELLRWKGEQEDDISAPFLGLLFAKHIHSPQGWVLGSSDITDVCDLQLATDHKTGVSRRHLKIDLSPDNQSPRITVLSRNPAQVYIKGRQATLYQGETLNITSSATIDLGQVTLRAWRPVLTVQEERIYRKNAQKFSQDFLDALPRHPVNLEATGDPTMDVRLGTSGMIYKQEPSYVSTGSFASVYKVRELHSKRVFAAKVPHFKQSDSPDVVRARWESLKKEFDSIAKLQHPYVVQAVECVIGRHNQEHPWLILEWVEMDLRAMMLDDQDIPVRLVLMHVSKGLEFMHSHGFTHRDLKPENILIQPRGPDEMIAKIADFGTTKHDISGKMQTFTGSSIYMAPEFWEDELAYTNAVDLWSLGMVAVEILTSWDLRQHSWSPLSRPSKVQHQEWVREELQPRMAKAPAEYLPFLQGLLNEDPRQRWSAKDCVRWLDASVVTTRQEHNRRRKRGSSSSNDLDAKEERFRRSNHPTLSTERALGDTGAPTSVAD